MCSSDLYDLCYSRAFSGLRLSSCSLYAYCDVDSCLNPGQKQFSNGAEFCNFSCKRHQRIFQLKKNPEPPGTARRNYREFLKCAPLCKCHCMTQDSLLSKHNLRNFHDILPAPCHGHIFIIFSKLFLLYYSYSISAAKVPFLLQFLFHQQNFLHQKVQCHQIVFLELRIILHGLPALLRQP